MYRLADGANNWQSASCLVHCIFTRMIFYDPRFDLQYQLLFLAIYHPSFCCTSLDHRLGDLCFVARIIVNKCLVILFTPYITLYQSSDIQQQTNIPFLSACYGDSCRVYTRWIRLLCCPFISRFNAVVENFAVYGVIDVYVVLRRIQRRVTG